MRVLYDHQVFEKQNFGGISRYFLELLSGHSGFEAEIAVTYSNNLHLLSHPRFRGRIQPLRNDAEEFLWGLTFRGKNRLHDLTGRILRRPKPGAANLENALDSLASGHFDVFHPTYFDPYFLESLGKRPFVLTVYDMIHEVYPEYFPLTDSTSARKRKLCEKATRIIAISHSTKNDLVQHFGTDPEKIDVVFLANSLKDVRPTNRAGNPPTDRYILFTGSRWGYKNFSFFARVITDILIDHAPLKLVCTGDPFNAEERSFFDEHSISHLIEHRAAVSDDDLANLYAGAEMFIFPSLHEGFGLPTLEAFACGCPALLSDTPVMREIAGDAAIYFHPKSASELRAAARKVLEDSDLKNTLVSRGLKRVSEFSWQKTGKATVEVYRRALGTEGRG